MPRPDRPRTYLEALIERWERQQAREAEREQHAQPEHSDTAGPVIASTPDGQR